MKITRNQAPAERLGTATEETNFSIKATAKAFRILSSGIYKDKIGAILRELSTNAYDAHLVSHKENVPFEVHLPTVMEPYFSVKDFGPGLSRENVLELYSTYFESTKTESISEIGAQGLGSKVPFSYTRAFTVISRYGGDKMICDAIIGTSGLPTIAVRSVVPMAPGETTGLEVVVPVKKQTDIYEFARKAPACYEFYPVPPSMTGEMSEPAKAEVEYSGNGFIIAKNRHRTARAIMGVIAYPISIDTNDIENIDKRIYALQNAPIDIEFPLGSLDFTAGREELSYDPETIEMLVARLLGVHDEINASCVAKFAECKTVREAKEVRLNILKSTNLAKLLDTSLSVTVNNRTVDSNYFELPVADFRTASFMRFDASSKPIIHKYNNNENDPDSFVANAAIRANKTQVLISPLETATRFLVRDEPESPLPYRRIFAAKSPGMQIIVVQPGSADELEKIKTHFDGFTFDLLSSLPKPPPAKKTKASLRYLAASHYNLAPNCHKERAWPTASVTLEDGGVYVITRHRRLMKEDEVADAMFASTLRALKSIDVAPRKIYAVPVTESSEIKKSDNWIEFWDFAASSLQKYVDENPETHENILHCRGQRLFSEKEFEYHKVASLVRLIGTFASPKHEINQFSRDLVAMYSADSIADVEAASAMLNIKLTRAEEARFNFVRRWNKINLTYPMLKYGIHENKNPVDRAQATVEYIAVVDQLAKNSRTTKASK